MQRDRRDAERGANHVLLQYNAGWDVASLLEWERSVHTRCAD